MKWLKSTSNKEWVVGYEGKQFIVPGSTKEAAFLSIEDDVYAGIAKLPVIASLLKAGGIIVLDEEPAELKNSLPMLQVTNTQLRAENDTLKARVAELEDQLKNATNIDIEAIKAAAVQPVQDALDAKQHELEDLDEKASKLLDEKDKKIAKLEAKLKKSGE